MPRKEPNRTTDAAILIRFKEEQRYRIETATAILVARTGVKSAKISLSSWMLECALAEADKILASEKNKK